MIFDQMLFKNSRGLATAKLMSPFGPVSFFITHTLRHVAAILGYKSSDELEELYKKTAWHFEAKTKKKGSSYDFFKQVRDFFKYSRVPNCHGATLINFWIFIPPPYALIRDPMLIDICTLVTIIIGYLRKL